jgi:protein TonB
MEHRHTLARHAPLAGGALLVLALILALVWYIHGLMSSQQQKPQRLVQNITVIRPPPPPPEDQPPPPPPDKVEEQVQQNEPEPTPDNAPTPPANLGLDAEGTAGDDGFGLAARRGGSDLVGGGGAVFAWYTGKVKDQLADRLSADPRLRGKKFDVIVRVWIEADGRVKDGRLTSTTGSRDLDGAIAAVVSSGRFDQGPPIEMPQPITLKIVSRT